MIQISKLVDMAADFAEYIHISQARKYTGEPYFNHLVEVAMTLHWSGCNERVVAAGFLHDCVEDQNVDSRELAALFGMEVARLVVEVTDVSKPGDGNRAFRKYLDREHLAKASPWGKTIKLADLISNTRNIVQHDPVFAKVYLAEKRDLLPYLKAGNTRLYELACETTDRALEELNKE